MSKARATVSALALTLLTVGCGQDADDSVAGPGAGGAAQGANGGSAGGSGRAGGDGFNAAGSAGRGSSAGGSTGGTPPLIDGCGAQLRATVRDLKVRHPDVEPCVDPVIAPENDSHRPEACVFEPGIVDVRLGPDGTPVYRGGSGKSTSGSANFASWYHDVGDGSDLSNQTIELLLEFAVNPDTGLLENILPESGQYFPIDKQLWGNELWMGKTLDHNYGFTTEFHAVFVAREGDRFYFEGDDDVWVFVDERLAIDLGGIHERMSREVDFDKLGLTPGEEYRLDFFHAERHATQSNFVIRTNLSFTKCGGVIE